MLILELLDAELTKILSSYKENVYDISWIDYGNAAIIKVNNVFNFVLVFYGDDHISIEWMIKNDKTEELLSYHRSKNDGKTNVMKPLSTALKECIITYLNTKNPKLLIIEGTDAKRAKLYKSWAKDLAGDSYDIRIIPMGINLIRK